MLVYHSSDCRFCVPDVLHSRDALDFGKGFYVTRLREQAEKYAERFLKAGKDAFLHVYEFSSDPDLRTKIFESYDEEWLDFVCRCRNGSDIYIEFDIIEGGVANDKVFQTVDLYMAGIYDKDQALRRLAFEMPNNQLCFVNQEAIDKCLEFKEHIIFNHG